MAGGHDLAKLVARIVDNLGDVQQRLATGHAFASGTVSPMRGNAQLVLAIDNTKKSVA